MIKKYCQKIKKVLVYCVNSCYHKIKIRDLESGENMDTNLLTIYDIANFFSSKGTMTSKKLQKLVYYAYSWYIALYNDNANEISNRLCEKTDFEAWVHGPVCRKLYNNYPSNYGIVYEFSGNLHSSICGEIKKFLNNIYKTFGKYTGDELEYMTHQELPWRNARKNLQPSEPSHKIISESDMFTYYNSL